VSEAWEDLFGGAASGNGERGNALAGHGLVQGQGQGVGQGGGIERAAV
jgi:hypothetical protein